MRLSQFIALSFLGLTPLIAGQAHPVSPSIELDLKARVEASCSIIDTSGSALAAGYQLRIISSCNTTQFVFNISNADGALPVVSASSSAGMTQTAGNQIIVRPNRPGSQEVFVVLDGNVDPSSNIQVELFAG